MNRYWQSVVVVALFALYAPQLLIAHGDLHERIEEISQLIKADPKNAELLFKRGLLLEQHGDHAAALADFDRVEVFAPNTEGLHFAKARSNFSMENYERSLFELDQIPSPASEEGRVFLWRGRVMARLGQPLNAGTNYRTAFARIERASPDLFIEYSRTIASAGTNYYPAAIQALDQGIEKIGPVITLNLEAVDLETKIGRYEDALARIDRMLDSTPGTILLLKRKGEILELLQLHQPGWVGEPEPTEHLEKERARQEKRKSGRR